MDATEKRKYCEKLPFFGMASEEEREYIVKNSFLEHFKTGELIYGKDGSCLGVIHMLSGKIRAYVMSEEGREVTLFRVEAGEDCVLSASCVISQITFETCISAEEECDALIIPSQALSRLMEKNTEVRCYLYEFLTERFSHVMWVMQSILFLHLDQRLAGFLVKTCEESGKTEIALTQEDIAREINSAREVVARMLKQFASDGLVELRRGTIVLKNLEGLKRIL